MKKSLYILFFITSLTRPLLASTLPCHPLPCKYHNCNRFCHDGHPINPACVKDIIGDVRGGAGVVNLSKCEAKKRHNDFTATLDGVDKPGYYSLITCDASKPKSSCANNAYIAYKVIGRIGLATFAVNIYSRDGGSRVFNSLALFKTYNDPINYDDSSYNEYLVRVATIATSDRALGTVIPGTVTMKGRT